MLKLDQFASANQASFDNLFSMSRQAFQGVEQLATLNLQTAKNSLAELEEGSQAALSVKSPSEFVQLQAAAWAAAPQKVVSYTQQVKEIVTAATDGQRAAFKARVADVQAKFLDAVNGALKNAPGSEKTIPLVQSAVSALNNVYTGVSNATQKVADAVEANVTKVTETAVKNSRKSLATIEA